MLNKYLILAKKVMVVVPQVALLQVKTRLFANQIEQVGNLSKARENPAVVKKPLILKYQILSL